MIQLAKVSVSFSDGIFLKARDFSLQLLNIVSLILRLIAGVAFFTKHPILLFNGKSTSCSDFFTLWTISYFGILIKIDVLRLYKL